MPRQRNVEEPTQCRIEISRLLDRQLRTPLVAVIEPRHPGFAAHIEGISVFGYGYDAVDAVEVLKRGIENIYRGEEFPDLRAVIRGMLLPENLMADRERESKEESTLWRQLLWTQKMEATGILANGVAHHFNNILLAVMGFANLLQMKMDPTDHLRIYVDSIFSAAGKAANLTQSLLAFARKQVIELKPHKASLLVRDAEKLLRRLVPENVEFETIINEDSMVMADAALINQALMNLTTNARDAMPQGGRLWIETKRAEIDGAFARAYGYGKPGTYAVFSITDTGAGMDEKTLQKAFDPFFTTREVGRGAGLGLSIVYGIVKQHGGYIMAHSQPGVGTAFHIYLPAGD
jgi:signal transduction histidine kinase